MCSYHENLELLLELVQIKSDTNTSQERDVEDYIFKYISQIPYFAQKKSFGLSKIPNDEHERAVVWALLKGVGDETIVMLNHHDVVDSFDYGALQKYAYTPSALKEALKSIPHQKDVLNDLNDDSWLFGRGTADMKAGAAIQLNLLKSFSETKNFKGNLLFLSVPDEESFSSGMRHSADLLVDLMNNYGLKYKLLINSEPHERKDKKYTIYDGSVGKVMATVYVHGKKTHIGNIFQGLNPSLLLSRLVMLTELNHNFSDKDLGEISPPPSWSFVRDFKDCYDASTPDAAGGYVSFLTLTQTPKDLLNSLKKLAIQAFSETNNQIIHSYQTLYPNEKNSPHYEPNVKLYEELLADARQKDTDAVDKVLSDCYKDIKLQIRENQLTMPESNFLIIKSLLEIAKYNIPTVVIALSPPYYPHVSSQKEKHDILTIKALMECSTDMALKKESYFMGISDLSYVGLQNSEEILPYVAPNMPLWNESFYTIPFESMEKISMPGVIVGPWGKDLHKMTERVYIPDLVEHTPAFIRKIINSLL